MSENRIYIGVDVGTSSVRALAVNEIGTILGCATEQLAIYEPKPEYYEQSSNQIWFMCCAAVKQLLAKNLFHAEDVRGIGFDATCSLVVVTEEGCPLSVSPNLEGASPTSNYVWNVIMWMDHRAKAEADEINKTNHSALESVGKTISPEMEPPKLLWLKRNKPSLWGGAGHFFDLADFLTFQATGSVNRSLCCVVCKWLYKANSTEGHWDTTFWDTIGLSELCDGNFYKIGHKVSGPGTPIDGGLSEVAAFDMGLKPGTTVATGIIDAHAGAIGVLCTKLTHSIELEPSFTNCLAMISGTSTCHMALSEKPLFVPGIWGPYYNAVIPGLWLNEAGQSAVGSLLDTVIQRFSDCQHNPIGVVEHQRKLLNDMTEFVKNNSIEKLANLAKDVHVWPDYHGNRSPLADPYMKGAIVGLELHSEVNQNQTLMSVYVAHVFSLAYMTRYIVETLEAKGHQLKILFICGGLQNNWLYVQAHADVLNRPVVTTDCDQCVALGAAVLAANASTTLPIETTMKALAQPGKVIMPQPQLRGFHDKKYAIFRKLETLVLEAQKEMN